MADNSEPASKQEVQLLQTAVQVLQMAVQVLQKTESASQKDEQAQKKSFLEGAKILYGTLEKRFFTWLVMRGSVAAFSWQKGASLLPDDRNVVVVVMVVLFLLAFFTVLLMGRVLQRIKSCDP